MPRCYLVFPPCIGFGMDRVAAVHYRPRDGREWTVIIRVLTARVPSPNVAEANVTMRELLNELRRQPGLAYAKLARRLVEGDAEEIVLIEEWLTPTALFAWTSGELEKPRLPLGAPELFEGLMITHFESLDRLPADLPTEVPAEPVLDGSAQSGRVSIGPGWRRRRMLEPRLRKRGLGRPTGATSNGQH